MSRPRTLKWRSGSPDSAAVARLCLSVEPGCVTCSPRAESAPPLFGTYGDGVGAVLPDLRGYLRLPSAGVCARLLPCSNSECEFRSLLRYCRLRRRLADESVVSHPELGSGIGPGSRRLKPSPPGMRSKQPPGGFEFSKALSCSLGRSPAG